MSDSSVKKNSVYGSLYSSMLSTTGTCRAAVESVNFKGRLVRVVTKQGPASPHTLVGLGVQIF